MQTSPHPDFGHPDFLQQHIRSILDFYEPRVMAADGGFYQCFLDNGDCYEPSARQLVGSARYVFNYASAYRIHKTAHYRDWAIHGLDYLNSTHRQTNGHYAWLIENNKVTDTRVMAYGHAFVLLAASSCVHAGILSAVQTLEHTWDFLEHQFWDEATCAYADETDASLTTLAPYRGQNANMHMCEAALGAWKATADPQFLDRAELLAQRFTVDLAEQATTRFHQDLDPANRQATAGMIWEHYDRDWQVDKEFNIDKPNDRYKPWGFQPGHQLEWAKLLLILNDARPNEQWLTRARQLFDKGYEFGWDNEFGGLVYSIAPDGQYCATEKYFWVHAEAFAAAWRLYKLTGEHRYLQAYTSIWQWAWKYLVDHKYGAWFRVVNRNGSAIDNKKSPFGKTDYHTLGSCWDVLAQH